MLSSLVSYRQWKDFDHSLSSSFHRFLTIVLEETVQANILRTNANPMHKCMIYGFPRRPHNNSPDAYSIAKDIKFYWLVQKAWPQNWYLCNVLSTYSTIERHCSRRFVCSRLSAQCQSSRRSGTLVWLCLTQTFIFASSGRKLNAIVFR